MQATNKKYFFHLAITIAIIGSAIFLPAIGPITAYGCKIIGIFCGVIYGYSTLGMTIPSFLALLALGFSGYGTVPMVLKNALGNGTVLYVFSIFLIAQLLSESHLTTKLINWIVTRKFTKGNPWALSYTVMVAAYVASFLVNAIVPTIILWALIFDLCDKIGYKAGDKWPAMMIFGVLYAASVGSFVAPFQIGVVSNFGMLTTASNGLYVLNYGAYFVWALVIGTILLMVWFAFARFVLRPDVEALKQENLFEEDTTPLTKEQIIVIGLVSAFVIGLFLPSLLPEGNSVKMVLDNLGSCGWGLLMVVIAVLIRVDGKNLYEFGDLFQKSVIWDITLMMACVFTLAGALVDPMTGVSQAIAEVVRPLINIMGAKAFLISIIAIVIISANLTNTIAACCIFIPIMYSITMNAGIDINIILFTACMNFVCGFCFLSPACSPNAAMMYGKKEWIPIPLCVLLACFVLISTYLVVIGIGIPLGSILF